MAKNNKKPVICAGSVVFRMNETGELDFLLVKHSLDESNTWGFPKGHLEGKESIEECAVRETWEESGVVARLLYEISPVFTSNRHEIKTVHFFLAKQLNPQHGIRANGKEISEVRWFSIDDLPEIHYYQKQVAKHAINIIKKHM
jgi:8-oxo-dGTP diphosphatase